MNVEAVQGSGWGGSSRVGARARLPLARGGKGNRIRGGIGRNVNASIIKWHHLMHY